MIKQENLYKRKYERMENGNNQYLPIKQAFNPHLPRPNQIQMPSRFSNHLPHHNPNLNAPPIHFHQRNNGFTNQPQNTPYLINQTNLITKPPPLLEESFDQKNYFNFSPLNSPHNQMDSPHNHFLDPIIPTGSPRLIEEFNRSHDPQNFFKKSNSRRNSSNASPNNQNINSPTPFASLIGEVNSSPNLNHFQEEKNPTINTSGKQPISSLTHTKDRFASTLMKEDFDLLEEKTDPTQTFLDPLKEDTNLVSAISDTSPKIGIDHPNNSEHPSLINEEPLGQSEITEQSKSPENLKKNESPNEQKNNLQVDPSNVPPSLIGKVNSSPNLNHFQEEKNSTTNTSGKQPVTSPTKEIFEPTLIIETTSGSDQSNNKTETIPAPTKPRNLNFLPTSHFQNTIHTSNTIQQNFNNTTPNFHVHPSLHNQIPNMTPPIVNEVKYNPRLNTTRNLVQEYTPIKIQSKLVPPHFDPSQYNSNYSKLQNYNTFNSSSSSSSFGNLSDNKFHSFSSSLYPQIKKEPLSDHPLHSSPLPSSSLFSSTSSVSIKKEKILSLNNDNNTNVLEEAEVEKKKKSRQFWTKEEQKK